MSHFNKNSLQECVRILKPSGSIFVTTINKTLTSWLGAIVIAEYILNLIPRGTHEWNKFIAPHQVQHMLDNCKFYTYYLYVKSHQKASYVITFI